MKKTKQKSNDKEHQKLLDAYSFSYNLGLKAGENDHWMTCENTIEEEFYDDKPNNYGELILRDRDSWEETEHFAVFYRKKIVANIKNTLKILDRELYHEYYSDCISEFWEGYVEGRKNININIFAIAKNLYRKDKKKNNLVERFLDIHNICEAVYKWKEALNIDDPLDGDDVELFLQLLSLDINYHEGNVSSIEFVSRRREMLENIRGRYE